MDLSLTEAANVLGQSERQVRYLIKTGRLAATKAEGRWRIARADLPLRDGQRAAMAERVQTARAAFEKGVEPVARATAPSSPAVPAAGEPKDGEPRKIYSVLDLHVFRDGEQLLRAVRAQPNASSVAASHLVASLLQLTRGCHCFHPKEKARCFSEARTEAADAVTHLLLGGEATDPVLIGLAQRIEAELIPRIGRLISAHERRAGRGRFDRLGGRFGFGREHRA